MKKTQIRPAHLGAPRRLKPQGVARVELRLVPALAARLYAVAEERGQSISRVGGDALSRGLESLDPLA